MDFEEFSSYVIKSEKLEALKKTLEPYSVAHMDYSCYHSFTYESQLSKAYRRENIAPQQVMKMKHLYSGSRGVLKALYNYFRRHSEFDVDYFLQQSDRVQMYQPDLNNIKLQGMFDDFTVAGAFSSAFFFVESAGVIGSYFLSSTLPPKRAEKLLCSGELEPLLIAAHHELYREHQADLNPWTNLGLLNHNALQVLLQICNGTKLDDIAQNLNMTKRGVDYHLAHLKSIFEAKNNCNLVAKAVALSAVDGSAIDWKSS